jgi:hypothetical protein|tara:strand:+ start:6687 stop:6848 length:162 start_codon:yes stop_codon:yes gene_type:complete
MYLVPIDGTQYFGAENISCPSCLIKIKILKTIFYKIGELMKIKDSKMLKGTAL